MARRGRGRVEHLMGTRKSVGLRETVNEAGEKVMKEAWQVGALCNDSYEKRTTFVADSVPYGFGKFPWAHDVCSGCQSKFYAKWIAENPSKIGYRIGGRLDLTNAPYGISKWAYKSVYPVYDKAILVDRDEWDQAIVGFICIQNGWGHSWEIHEWMASDLRFNDVDKPDVDLSPKMGGIADKFDHEYMPSRAADDIFVYSDEIRTYESGGQKKPFKSEAKGFPSKEYALLNFIPHMVADGCLKSYNDRLDEATGYRVAEQRRREERVRDDEQRRIEREERNRQTESDNDVIMDGMLSLAERDDLDNIEREALFMAFKRIFGKEMVDVAATATKLSGEPVNVILVKPTRIDTILDGKSVEDPGDILPVGQPVADDDDWSFS